MAFIIYIAALSLDSGYEMHPFKKAQISYLKADEAFIKVSSQCTDFVDGFSLKLAIKLPKYTKINNHVIKLIDDWQPPYDSIYSLRLVELETLKAYIENNLSNSFIKPCKSSAGVLIFFNKNLDSSLRLYVDY